VFDFLLRPLRDILDVISAQLMILINQGVTIMSKLQDINDLIARLNAATNEVASDLSKLREDIKGLLGGVSSAEADAVIASLDEASDRLEVVGADPTDPIPPVVE
jgi:predicted transcriptional regulator